MDMLELYNNRTRIIFFVSKYLDTNPIYILFNNNKCLGILKCVELWNFK